VHGGVVETTPQNDAVCDGAKRAVSGRIRLREQRVGVVDVAERAGACSDRASVPMIRHH
jgi:hypothetical protein